MLFVYDTVSTCKLSSRCDDCAVVVIVQEQHLSQLSCVFEEADSNRKVSLTELIQETVSTMCT